MNEILTSPIVHSIISVLAFFGASYVFGRIFTKAVIHELENHLIKKFNKLSQIKKQKENGKEQEKEK